MSRKHERNGMSRRRQQRKIHERRWAAAMNLLVKYGFGGLARAMEILINEAMKTEARNADSDGYKTLVAQNAPQNRSDGRLTETCKVGTARKLFPLFAFGAPY